MVATQLQIKSMTAFAKTQNTGSETAGRFSWEVRSVNQRYLEINPRLQDAFKHLENDLRDLIKSHVQRGKVDVSLSYENSMDSSGMQVNNELLNALTQAVSQVQQNLPEATHVNPLEILQWPGVLQNETSQGKQKTLDKTLLTGLENTITEFNQHRQREGQALAELILQRCQSINTILETLEPELPNILARHIDKLKTRIESLSEQLDEQRFHQEVAIISQKMDIAEEIDRLKTHLKEVQHILTHNTAGKAVGRRLDFLMQELNREANTLGSKSIDAQISQASVEFKVLIEQMREQVQNIE